MVRYLNEKDVENLLAMPLALDTPALRRAAQQLQQGTAPSCSGITQFGKHLGAARYRNVQTVGCFAHGCNRPSLEV